MTITAGMADSFKSEILTGTHALDSDTLKLALYTSDATLSRATTAYSATNEVSGTGYTAGGKTLTGVTVALDSDRHVAYLDADDVAWTGLTLTDIRGALLYNASQGNKAIAIFDFGGRQEVTAGTFTVVLPSGDGANAMVRVG